MCLFALDANEHEPSGSSKDNFAIFSKNTNNINPDRVNSQMHASDFVFSDLFGLGLKKEDFTR